jgi:hypothetical protein
MRRPIAFGFAQRVEESHAAAAAMAKMGHVELFSSGSLASQVTRYVHAAHHPQPSRTFVLGKNGTYSRTTLSEHLCMAHPGHCGNAPTCRKSRSEKRGVQ